MKKDKFEIKFKVKFKLKLKFKVKPNSSSDMACRVAVKLYPLIWRINLTEFNRGVDYARKDSSNCRADSSRED